MAKKSNNSCGPAPQNTWVYSDAVKEHFLDPHNFLMGDETNFPHNAVGVVGNPICGDQMKMFLQIAPIQTVSDEFTKNVSGQLDKTDPNQAIIKDVRWKTYGCASAIASTSALSELVKGKTLEDALKVDAEQIATYLGGLPKHKFHCSVLGHEALAAAIKNWQTKNS